MLYDRSITEVVEFLFFHSAIWRKTKFREIKGTPRIWSEHPALTNCADLQLWTNFNKCWSQNFLFRNTEMRMLHRWDENEIDEELIYQPWLSGNECAGFQVCRLSSQVTRIQGMTSASNIVLTPSNWRPTKSVTNRKTQRVHFIAATQVDGDRALGMIKVLCPNTVRTRMWRFPPLFLRHSWCSSPNKSNASSRNLPVPVVCAAYLPKELLVPGICWSRKYTSHFGLMSGYGALEIEVKNKRKEKFGFIGAHISP